VGGSSGVRDRRWVRQLGVWLVPVAIGLAACSDGGGSEAETSARSDDQAAVTTTTTAAAGSGSTAICAIFEQRRASGAGPGAQYEASTPEGWERRIETTGDIVEAAPAQWRDEAETYLEMVKDRAQLAADNGYVGVNDLPADVRTDFITSHRAMQAEVNELIAYMSGECQARPAG
jgi:hypothetical protein